MNQTQSTMHRHLQTLITTIAFVLIVPSIGSGQGSFVDTGFGDSGFGQTGDVFPSLSFGELAPDENEETATWSAEYFATGSEGLLKVKATIGDSWHLYSTTQPKGGPLPTRFQLDSPDNVSVVGAFTPSEPPEKSVSTVYPGLTIEEHAGEITWTTSLKLPQGFRDEIKVVVKALACQNGGACVEINETLVAAFAGPATSAPKPIIGKTTTFREEDYPVEWKIGVSESIASGSRGQLVFSAKPESEFHVYHAVVDDAQSATNFVLTKKNGSLVGAPSTENEIVAKTLFPGGPKIEYHKGEVTWRLPVEIPDSKAPGEFKLEGFVGYQACTDSSCLQPQAFKFVATVSVSDKNIATLKPVEVSAVKFSTAIEAAGQIEWVDQLASSESGAETPSSAAPTQSSNTPSEPGIPTEDTEGSAGDSNGDSLAATSVGKSVPADTSLPLILLMAFGGGIILNLMPCVLPVVGIKIMSFVQQAGEDRKRVFLLNFVYAAGILVVFALLAVLAAAFSFKWGQQFQYFEVRLTLTVLIFAMALSYLGVWELPTPGVATGQASQKLQEREGLGGAFFKGMFATVLATPCSGPMLGFVFGATGEMAAIEKAAVFLTIGLGMAVPYIILGIFPSAIGFMPKPGNWMVTLKEFLAFLFLATVAYFFNQFADGQKLAVFVTLIGVWFGCWAIGKVPPWEVFQKQLRGWTFGVGSAVAIGWLAFTFLVKSPPPVDLENSSIQYVVDRHITWEKYDEPRLQQLHQEGKTVMLDFTASWCVNCIYNTHTALDTEATSELLHELNGVAMLADKTNPNEQIDSKMDELKSQSIPLLVIYPGSRPNEPIVLRDVVSQSTVLEALRQAGPSRPGTSSASIREANLEFRKVR